MRFLKIILSVFALFYRLTPNYLIISDVYFLHRKVDFAWESDLLLSYNVKLEKVSQHHNYHNCVLQSKKFTMW